MKSIFVSIYTSFCTMFILSIACLDAETAQFKDVILLLNSSRFWNLVFIVTLLFLGLQILTSPSTWLDNGISRFFTKVKPVKAEKRF